MSTDVYGAFQNYFAIFKCNLILTCTQITRNAAHTELIKHSLM